MAVGLLLMLAPATAGAAEARAANDDAEARMIDAINAVRKSNGLYPLRSSDSLHDSARAYSHWLMASDSFGHQDRIRASSDFAFLGEALEMHSGRRFSVRRTVERWMGSATHRALVLTSMMRWAGAGVTRGRFGANPATIWVLHLGRLHPPGAPLPVPSLPLP
jgi:uncharacterized protein YkwD